MASDKIEMRGMAPVELAQALDAFAHADGQDRNSYVVNVLHLHVKEKAHKAMMAMRMLRGNPYVTEAPVQVDGGDSK
jgi:hypothetical protein